MLALIGGFRLVVFRQPIDWLTVGLVIVAAVAAIAHRNAVGGLEARGRGEAESFARILRGLSRSVSADAIVAAILDDLIDATAADHVVLVRRRPEARSLEARLVTRRAGHPDDHHDAARLVARPDTDRDAGFRGRRRRARAARHAGSRAAAGALADPRGAAADLRAAGRSARRCRRRRSRCRRPRAGGRRCRRTAHAGDRTRRAGRDPDAEPAAGRAARDGSGRRPNPRSAVSPPNPSRCCRTSACRRRTCSARGARRSRSRCSRAGPRPRSSSGSPIACSPRSACRTRSPRRSDPRARSSARSSCRVVTPHAWSESARRLLRGAASETAAALVRAESYREATAGAATDPLTGLPNRRYFDEFASLLAGGRRSGDARRGPDDRHRQVQGPQRHVRPPGGRPGPPVRRRGDHVGRARPGRAGPDRRRGVRRPAPQPRARWSPSRSGSASARPSATLDLGRLGVPGVSVSVGVANATGPDEAIAAVVDRADQALLRAKRAGRDRVIAGVGSAVRRYHRLDGRATDRAKPRRRRGGRPRRGDARSERTATSRC